MGFSLIFHHKKYQKYQLIWISKSSGWLCIVLISKTTWHPSLSYFITQCSCFDIQKVKCLPKKVRKCQITFFPRMFEKICINTFEKVKKKNTIRKISRYTSCC